jgi:membrane protein
MLSFLLNCKRIYNDFIKDEVTVYAAQASFFIVLSAAPFIMILLTLIQKVYSILAYLAIPVILVPYVVHMAVMRFDTKK